MDFICEAFDQMQRAFDLNGFNDHQLHCVLRFDSGAAPDAAILRRAVIASIEAIPILGTRYADGAKPRWAGLDPESCARALVDFQIPRKEIQTFPEGNPRKTGRESKENRKEIQAFVFR